MVFTFCVSAIKEENYIWSVEEKIRMNDIRTNDIMTTKTELSKTEISWCGYENEINCQSWDSRDKRSTDCSGYIKTRQDKTRRDKTGQIKQIKQVTSIQSESKHPIITVFNVQYMFQISACVLEDEAMQPPWRVRPLLGRNHPLGGGGSGTSLPG